MNDTTKTIAAKPVPFRINHNLAARLPDQVADGFRQAIVSGYYRKGDVLPRFADIAKTLGVSLRIPREAIAVLAAENLVSPRPRLGCMVLGRERGAALVAGEPGCACARPPSS